ncbi:MAG: hypothetical protein V4463_23580 [Pseudomonadota bacterium]
MNDNIRRLLTQISALEEELADALHAQEHKMFFTIKGRRVEFERSVRDAHRKLKTSFFHWLVTDRPQNLITGPIIYGMALPLLLFDLCITIYQATCFPIYGVRKVRRRDYIIFDRQQLDYLNFIEKFHCTYCAYGAGLLAYAGEIVARTEHYFCPIKHAHKVLGTHAHYAKFLDYGDALDFEVRLEAMRKELGKEEEHEP